MRPRLLLDLAAALLTLAVLTFLIRWFGWDLRFSSWFHHSSKGWYLADAQPWKAIYLFGTLPAILCAAGAVVAFVAGFKVAWLRRWRKLCLFLVLALIVGPGLVVNAALKDNWGRPRPRQVEEFGGNERFEPVLRFEPDSGGKSFPCGHCSMGFYFLALYLFLRRIRSRWWLPTLLGSLALGTAIGMARIVQGGHFPSDVLWSGGLCFLTSFALFYALRLDREPFYVPSDSESATGRVPRGVMVAAALVLGIGLAAFSLATPYHGRFSHEGSRDPIAQADRVEIVLRLATSTARVRVGESLRIEGDANGFGVPGSAIKEKWRESLEGGEYSAELKQRTSGFFSELESSMEVEVPAVRHAYVKIVAEKTDVTIDLSGLPSDASVEIRGAGDAVPPGFARTGPGELRRGQDGDVSLKLVLETGERPVTIVGVDR